MYQLFTNNSIFKVMRNNSNTPNWSSRPQKTDCRGFANYIADMVLNLDTQIQRGRILDQEEYFYKDYTFYEFFHKCLQHQEGCPHILLEPEYSVLSHNGIKNEILTSYRLRLNIEDADISLRISQRQGELEAKLHIGNKFVIKLHCQSGAFLYLLTAIYGAASTLSIAA